ncbi:MAG: hypothetical protein ACPLN2_09630 [Thermoproteota archaeon]|jgi:hypothetical protein
MERRKLKASYFFFVNLLILSMFLSIVSTEPVPPWVKKGTVLVYEGEASSITFFNRSLIPKQLLNLPGVSVTGGSAIVSLYFNKSEPIRLLLVVNKVEGTMGLVNVTLEIGPFSSSTNLTVDFSKRDVFLMKGVPLGKTIIWIPPCKNGDIIQYVGDKTSAVFASVSSSYASRLTPKGRQDALSVSTIDDKYEGIFLNKSMTTTEAQSSKYFNPRINYYDADTFVLIDGRLDQDAFISAFGIILLNTFFHLTYTNIDLGPPELLSTLVYILSYVVLVVAIIGVPLYVFLIRKKRAS